MVFPYGGFFCMLNSEISDYYRNEPSISVLEDDFLRSVVAGGVFIRLAALS